MFRSIAIMTTILFMLALPAFAGEKMDHGKMEGMDHGKVEGMDHDKMEGMDHGKMEGMDHGKMEGMDHGKMDHKAMMDGDGMAMLGSETVNGVMARTHIKDVSEAMAKMGMEQTHHLMVSFVKDDNGAEGTAIEKGSVAVKVRAPGEREGKPVKMMGMDGHFGADLTLKKKGKYHFYIGTKLEDGEKRKYHFHTVVE